LATVVRKEPELTVAYRKDQEEEKFLQRFNNILAPFQEEDYQDLPEVYPTLHIIGVPRSGTTLLSQLVSAHLRVGYINNLIAAFWRAPVYGIRLSKKLIPPGMPSSYQSTFGRSMQINEPHEFGYFWSSLLNYEEMLQQDEAFAERINWERVRLILTNMTHAFGRPVAFKSVLLCWHIAHMQSVLPKSCFVRIRRDPVQNAISLLYYREQFLGSVERWVSLKPAEYQWLKDKPYWQQVVGQIYYLEKATTAQIEKVNGHNVLEVTYAELCDDPKRVLLKIQDLLTRNGTEVELINPPERFHVSERAARSREEYRLIESTVREFYVAV
jgi:hypothetical protein